MVVWSALRCTSGKILIGKTPNLEVLSNAQFLRNRILSKPLPIQQEPAVHVFDFWVVLCIPLVMLAIVTINTIILLSKLFRLNLVLQKRMHRTMIIQPSRWQWHKFKDMFHLYFMVGAIPLTAIIFYCNVFIGPATLAEIPEGYNPKHWEYYKHPITRFMARYVYPSLQQDYEKYLHFLYEEDEKRKMRRVMYQVLDKMKARSDYQAFYYRPISSRYHIKSKELAEEMDSAVGLN